MKCGHCKRDGVTIQHVRSCTGVRSSRLPKAASRATPPTTKAKKKSPPLSNVDTPWSAATAGGLIHSGAGKVGAIKCSDCGVMVAAGAEASHRCP